MKLKTERETEREMFTDKRPKHKNVITSFIILIYLGNMGIKIIITIIGTLGQLQNLYLHLFVQ